MLDHGDMEKIELSLEEGKKIQRMGFESKTHWEEFRGHVVTGLYLFGDRFLRALGVALHRANTDNAIRIIRIWRQECEQHAMLYKIKLAKEKAQNDPSQQK